MLENFNKIFGPRDVIACIVLFCGFTLLYFGIDTIVGGVVIAVVTYYFVRTEKNDNKTDN